MKLLRRISSALILLEQSCVVVLLSVMVILAFLQVILRNFFSTGFIWGDTLLRHLVLWLGFLGAAIAAESGKHISIDIIGRLVPPRIATLIRIITNLFAMVVSFYLAKAGWTFLQSERETGDILITIAEQPLPAQGSRHVVVPLCHDQGGHSFEGDARPGRVIGDCGPGRQAAAGR